MSMVNALYQQRRDALCPPLSYRDRQQVFVSMRDMLNFIECIQELDVITEEQARYLNQYVLALFWEVKVASKFDQYARTMDRLSAKVDHHLQGLTALFGGPIQ